jgi:hypothetical protein
MPIVEAIDTEEVDAVVEGVDLRVPRQIEQATTAITVGVPNLRMRYSWRARHITKASSTVARVTVMH